MCRKQKRKQLNSFRKLYDKALREVGESGAAIFEVHQMMLDDEDYLDSIDNIIRTENVKCRVCSSKQQAIILQTCLRRWMMTT